MTVKSSQHRSASHRRRTRPVFIVVILIAIAVSAFFIIKNSMDNSAASSELASFNEMIEKKNYVQAKSYYTQKAQTLTGSVRDKFLQEAKKTLERDIEAFFDAAKKEPLGKQLDQYKHLDQFRLEVEPIFSQKTHEAVQAYIAQTLEYTQVKNLLDNLSGMPFTELIAAPQQDLVEAYKVSREAFAAAKAALDQGDTMTAIANFNKVIEQDAQQYQEAQQYLSETKDELLQEVLTAVQADIKANRLSTAKEKLDLLMEVFESNTAFMDKYNQVLALIDQQEIVNYTGPVEHVFTHALIAYPDICFALGKNAVNYDRDCITPKEFRRFLEAVYNKDYVLIDINMLYSAEEVNGEIQVKQNKTLKLPKGKKPLVLSFDDIVYNTRNRGQGMVDKLVVHEGKIASSTLINGQEDIRFDVEFAPILEQFLDEYPDFSYNGARGTICLTGYQGILGYRTHRDSPNRDAEIAAVKPVIELLKSLGWTFASNSYKHDYISTKMSVDSLQDDLEKWKNEVESLVGPTHVFVYPYGDWPPVKSEKHALIKSYGFYMYCGIGMGTFITSRGDNFEVFQDRKHIDGLTLRNQKDKWEHMFDTAEILDEGRLAFEYDKSGKVISNP